MTKAVVFVATVLVASLGVIAQTDTAPQSGSPMQNASAQRVVTRIGCLTAPSGAGTYVLAGSSGIAYVLAGDTSSLQGHMGQEIQVTGQLTTAVADAASSGVSDSASDAIRSRNDNEGTIQVTEAKVVSQTCQAEGNSESSSPSGAASDSKHPKLKAISDPPKDIGADDSPSPGDTKSNAELPQTSTVLPLLGLIGLGSLVAGFFARK